MAQGVARNDTLFEVTDVFGRKIRTTENYWKKIREFKHKELRLGIPEVKKTLINPDEVRQSVTDRTILLFAKGVENHGILIVAVKVLNGDGFLVTVYQTREYKKKGTLLWPKQSVR